jgi:tetratricopeptide (TPR) repeat protein
VCEAELRRAERSDPLSYPIANSLSELYYNWRKYELAIAEAKVAAELEPSQLNPYHVMALSYAAIGRADEALEAADRAGAEEHHGVEVWLAGSRDDQRRYVDRTARTSYAVAHPYSIACMYAKAGDSDQAIRWLERAYDAHQPDLALVKVAPDFDSVRADTRYADIVHRVGLAD